MRVAILGAGIAGVAVGRELNLRGLDVRVFEREPEAGGLCRSVDIDGYTFDIGGVHVLHSKDAGILQFMLDTLRENVCCSERRAGISHDGMSLRFPLASHLSELPAPMRLAAVASLFRARATSYLSRAKPRSFHEWTKMTFGDYLAELHYLPYAEKLWKTHPAALSVEWLRAIVPPPRVRSSFRLTRDRRTQSIYHPITGGIQALVEELSASIRDRLQLGCPVECIERSQRRFRVNGEHFDAVVSTLPLATLASICPGLQHDMSRTGLRYVSLTTLCIATDGPPRFDESWIYIPSRRDSPAHRVSCMNNLGSRHLAAGSAIVAEVTSSFGQSFSRDSCSIASVVASLVDLGLIDQGTVRFVEVFHFPYSYVLGDLQYDSAREAATLAASRFGIHLLGRFGEHRQSNIDQVLRSARSVSEVICRLN